MRDPARAWFYGKLILDMIIAFLLLDFALFVSVFVYLYVHAHMRINRWKIYAYIGICRYTSMCTIIHASAGVCASFLLQLSYTDMHRNYYQIPTQKKTINALVMLPHCKSFWISEFRICTFTDTNKQYVNKQINEIKMKNRTK